MPRTILFGYSVEMDEGTITISLSGSMAGAVLEDMAGRWGRGRRRGGGRLPLLPSGWLGSGSVSLGSLLAQSAEPEEDGPEDANADAGAEADAPDLKEVFGQGFDSSYQEFEAKLLAYRELVSGDAPSQAASAAASPAPAEPAPAPAAESRPARDAGKK